MLNGTEELSEFAPFRLDGTEFRVVSATEEQVELSFRSAYDPSRLNSVPLNVDKRCAHYSIIPVHGHHDFKVDLDVHHA